MFDQKKIAEDYTFFANLFNLAEKDQDDELYKKKLYVLKNRDGSRPNSNIYLCRFILRFPVFLSGMLTKIY